MDVSKKSSGRSSRQQDKSNPFRMPKNIRKAFAKHERGAVPESDTRVLTYNGVINTTTGSVIGATIGSGLATSATEYASMAARYQEFRVLAVKVKWCPRFGQANESCAVAESGQPLGCIFTSGVAPSSVAAMAASDGFKIAGGTSKHLELEVDHKVNPNALFWAPATGSVASVNQFGITIRHPGVCPANLNNVNCVDYYAEFVVEFRTAS